MKAQMQGLSEVLEVEDEVVERAEKKNRGFEHDIRKRLESIHLNTSVGEIAGLAGLAAEDVEVNENGSVSRGRQAFVDLVTARRAGRGSFPNKLFHDSDVSVDANFGTVSYVWQAVQEKRYESIDIKAGAVVRMRGVLFVEIDDAGQVVKAIDVDDENVVRATLMSAVRWLYP